jgi:hypothetical protein
MHETFEIIRPFLEEHGIVLKHVAPSWRDREKKTCIYALKTQWGENCGEMQIEGERIMVEPKDLIYKDKSNRGGWPRIDLHNPESLNQLVEWIRWKHSPPNRTIVDDIMENKEWKW